MTTCGYLLIFMFVGTALSILWRPRRPPPHQPLSDSCASAAFRDQDEARRRA